MNKFIIKQYLDTHWELAPIEATQDNSNYSYTTRWYNNGVNGFTRSMKHHSTQYTLKSDENIKMTFKASAGFILTNDTLNVSWQVLKKKARGKNSTNARIWKIELAEANKISKDLALPKFLAKLTLKKLAEEVAQNVH
jgi:hypothetical protein